MKLSMATMMGLATTTLAYECINFTVPLTVSAASRTPAFAEFQSSLDSVQFLDTITTWAYASQSPFNGSQNITISASIAAQYCYPSDSCASNVGQVQVLTHGIGFDRSYWEFGGPSSLYNYIEAATAAGFSTLSYDRLGTGGSTITDPYTIQQLGPELAVLVELTSRLRQGILHPSIRAPSKVAHVGHSFGSIITSNLGNSHPNLTDCIVLTGYSANGSFAQDFAISSNFEVAAEVDPPKWSNLSKGFLTWPDKHANQYSFFTWPYFDPSVLDAAEAAKEPVAVGEFLTAVPTAAPNYGGPLLIISGAFDRIFCGGYCDGVLQAASSSYPKAKPFQTYIQPNTGHGMNLHYNATGFYLVISNFIQASLST